MQPVDMQKALVDKYYKEFNTFFYSMHQDIGKKLTYKQQLDLMVTAEKKLVELRRLLISIINRGTSGP